MTSSVSELMTSGLGPGYLCRANDRYNAGYSDTRARSRCLARRTGDTNGWTATSSHLSWDVSTLTADAVRVLCCLCLPVTIPRTLGGARPGMVSQAGPPQVASPEWSRRHGWRTQ